MSKATINYVWGIDDKEKWTNLTGSQTIFWLDIWKTKNPKIVVDAWAVQWVKKALELNKMIKKEVMNAEFLIITHAHSDHAGMVPYLYKKGFSWRIIMTELTKLQSKEMWLDYVKLTENEIEKVKEMNEKIGRRLHQALQIVEHFKITEDKKSSLKKFKNSEKYLIKILWTKKFDEAYNESIAILKEYWVECENDIWAVLRDIPELLFDRDDIELVYNKIETLWLKEELELQNFHPISSWKDELILELPEMVKNWFNKPIPVVSYLKGTVTSKLQFLIKKISKETEENEITQAENEALSNKIKLALNFVKWYEDNWESIVNFENEYGALLNENEGELLLQMSQLSKNTLNGTDYNIIELLKIYQSFKFKFPDSLDNYTQLQKELTDLWIFNEKDIDKHLPELPDSDYENKDIKSALKKVIITEKSDIDVSDYIVYIKNINQFSPQEILWFFKEQKRIYIHSSIYTKLLEKILTFVNHNNENIKRNNYIQEALYNAFDLVSIYEWNTQLYLEKNKKEYNRVKKIVEKYKRPTLTESIYSQDDLDYIIDIDYHAILKDKNIIHIKRLDDSRLYDILFQNNINTVYYFEPKIRARIKEKLSEYISKIETQKVLNSEKIELYQKNIDFIKIYEWKETLNISLEEYNTAKVLLGKHSIQSKKDIENFDIFDTTFPFITKDVENYFKMVNWVDDNFSLDSIDMIHITDIDDERIYDLPYNYENTQSLVIVQDGLKSAIRKKLLEWIWDFFRTSTIRRKKRNQLLEKFRLFKNYTENYQYLFNLDGYKNPTILLNELLSKNSQIRSISEKLNKIRCARELKSKLSEWDIERDNDYKEAKKMLTDLQIKSLSDISKVLKVPHYMPYSIEDIKKTISLLKSIHIDKNQDILESIKLNFFDAWHIEWSVQAVLTLVVSEVDNIINGWSVKKVLNTGWKRRLKHVNYWFSWDLWRIKDPNLAGSPEPIPFKLDYYQSEATYADRNHLDKEIAISKLFASIQSAQWKIVIPAFSMQRTQELLMILLEQRVISQTNIDQLKEIEREKLDTEVELLTLLTNTNKLEIKERKTELEKRIQNLELRINYLKSKIFDIDIILDSPLSEKITNIYITKCWNKYNLLDPKVQKELFWKEVITYVKKSGWGKEEDEDDGRISLDDLYEWERKDKKEVIFSASGMWDGWAITPHLKNNLQNPKSKIIWVWYCPPNTRWWKIKSGDDFISIDGEPYELKCEVDDVAWFSWHIDEEELILLLTQMEFKKWAIIALTHGDEKRLLLSEKVQSAMEEIWKKVKLIVPKLWDILPIKI